MKHPAAFAPVLALLCLCLPAAATDFRSTPGAYTLERNESLTNELWLMASTISIRGQAADDLFLMSAAAHGTDTNTPASIQLAGKVLGDVWAAGDSIETAGEVERHARLLGYRFVQTGGWIGHNLMAAGGAVSLLESASVAGDALLAGREVIAQGAVKGKTRIYAESATLSGAFGGDVTITAPKINILPGTRIGGDLRYQSGEDLILDSNVTLGGKLVRLDPPPKPGRPPLTLGDVTLQLALCAAALLAGLVFTALFPAIMVSSLHRLTADFWKSLLLGFVAFCLIPMTAFFLLFTLIGIPLSLLALSAYGILLYLGKTAAALGFGYWLLYRRNKPAVLRLFPLLALGLFAAYALALLPFPIDILVWFGFTLPGMGALAGAIMDRRSAVIMPVPPNPAAAPPPLPGPPFRQS